MPTLEEGNTVTVEALLDCGAHFGHQRRRWNPKMKRFILKEQNGIYIIDLAKTVSQIMKAIEVIEDTVSKRKSILFVGTKKQAKGVIRECAEECGEFYVCERWLGGILTNLSTIRQSVKTLERIEKQIASGEGSFTKKELGMMSKEQIKLNRNLSGIRSMRKIPGLLIVVDPGKEHIAVAEANKLGIPVMALVDTNCDPDPIDYIIPCNDDALKSIKFVLQTLKGALMSKKEEMRIAKEEENALEEFRENQGEKGDEMSDEDDELEKGTP